MMQNFCIQTLFSKNRVKNGVKKLAHSIIYGCTDSIYSFVLSASKFFSCNPLVFSG